MIIIVLLTFLICDIARETWWCHVQMRQVLSLPTILRRSCSSHQARMRCVKYS